MATKWTRIPIKQVYQGLYDGPHATPKPSEEGPIFLGIKNITEQGSLELSSVRHIAEADFPKWTKRVEPKEGDIVFTYEATLNRYAIIPKGFRGCLGRRLALIRPDKSRVNHKFLFFYFFGDDWSNTISRNILSGSTVDRIPLTKFPEFEISLPTSETQDKIASILSAYDDLIENNLKRIKILEEMAQMIYREWFVNFRFPGHERVKMVDSPLGKIPEGWEVKKLADCVELAYGKALKKENRRDGNVPVYGSGGLCGYHDEPLANGPGIIVGRKGNVGSVFWTHEDFYPIDTVFYVKTKLDLYYVYYNLLGQNFINNDAAVPGLNRNQAYSNSFLLPDTKVMGSFSETISPIFEQVRTLNSKNENLRKTRDLLLPKLISGELDVDGLEIKIEESP